MVSNSQHPCVPQQIMSKSFRKIQGIHCVLAHNIHGRANEQEKTIIFFSVFSLFFLIVWKLQYDSKEKHWMSFWVLLSQRSYPIDAKLNLFEQFEKGKSVILIEKVTTWTHFCRSQGRSCRWTVWIGGRNRFQLLSIFLSTRFLLEPRLISLRLLFAYLPALIYLDNPIIYT